MDELTIAFKIESPPSWLPIGSIQKTIVDTVAKLIGG